MQDYRHLPDAQLRSMLSSTNDTGKIIYQRLTELFTPEQVPAALGLTLSSILRAPSPMIIIWGPELLTFGNEAANTLFNKAMHPLAGVPASAFFRTQWDTLKPHVLRILKGVTEEAKTGSATFLYRSNQTEGVINYTFSPIYGDADKVSGCYVTCTENAVSFDDFRKLKERENLFRFAIEATELGIWDYNPKSGRFTSNERLREIFGLPDEEEIELSAAAAIIVDHDRQRAIDAINTALTFESGGNFDIVYDVKNAKNGQIRTLHVKGRARFNADKEATQFNGTLQDITEIRANNKKAEENERRFRTLIEQSPVAKCLLRGDNLQIDIVNSRMLQLWQSHTVAGKPAQILNSIKPGLFDEVRATLHSGKTLHLEEQVIDIKGKTCYYNLNFKPIQDQDGSVFGIIHTAIDVTAQVNARQAVEKSEDHFRNLISQAPVAIGLFVGRNHIIEMANGPMLDIIGKGNDVIGKPLVEVMPELQGEMKRFLTVMDEIFEKGIAFNAYEQKANILRNGVLSENYYDITYSPIFDHSGKVYGILEIAIEVSEKVLAQRQILESESRFRNLVESAPIPIGVYTGREMRIMLANKTIMRIFGKGEDVVGRLYSEVNPELENQEVFKQLEQVYLTGEPFQAINAKIDLVDKGEVRSYYFNYNFTPLRDASGAIYGVLNTASDVTALNRTRLDLEESEKNLRNIIVQAPVAMCILRSSDLIVEIANHRMYELWGKPEQFMAGKPLFNSLYELEGQGFHEILMNVIQTGETYQAFGVPVFLPRANGLEQVFVDFVYQAIKEADGQISGVLVVAIDVTVNVIARQRIEEAERRALLAIDSAKMGTYEINLVTNEIKVSRRFREIFGVREKRPSRASLAELVHPEDRTHRMQAHQKAAETGELKYECRLLRPDNSVVYVRVNGYILKDDAGEPGTLLGVVQDITEEKLFAQELSKQVKDRTQELYRSNEDLMRFAHVASHDLKEPVRKIKVFSNMIEEQFGSQIPEKAHTYLAKVQSATDRMFSMIEGVLAYSALNASDQPIEQISLNETFGSILVDLEILIEQKQADLKIDDLPDIEGAPVLIYQLFYNLINNALKFSREGVRPQIDVRGKIVVKNEQNFVCLEIEDNGIGIEPSYAEKIFDAFARLHPKDKFEGTGLGLALCKKIVERHHGTIYAKGSTGSGSVFTVLLLLQQTGRLL